MLSVLPSVEFQCHQQRYQPCREGSWQCFSSPPLPSSHSAQPPEPACPAEVLNQLCQKLICLALNLEMTMGDFYLIPAFHNITILGSLKEKIIASSWWDRLSLLVVISSYTEGNLPRKCPMPAKASLQQLPSHISWQFQLSYKTIILVSTIVSFN